MDRMKTAKDISQMLAERAEEVAALLLPNGKKIGAEWCAGSTAGEAGKSLKVRLTGTKAGVWCDFSGGDKGDLLDLWGASRGCTFVEALKAAKEWLGIRDEGRSVYQPKPGLTYSKPDLKGVSPLVRNSPALDYLTKIRGISPETLNRYKVRDYMHPQHGPACVFPVFEPGVDTYPSLLKYLAVKRDSAGKKVIWASAGCKPHLFGWPAIGKNCRELVITEGEIDAMTVADWGYPAVSVHSGTQNLDWIDHDFDELARFSKIYILTDQDEPGEKCAEAIAHRLGRDRCYRVRLAGFKDANEAHLSGQFLGPDFCECIAKAATLDPQELKNASEYTNDVWEEFYPSEQSLGSPTPWHMDWTVRPGELTLVTGWSGHGKSHLLCQLMLEEAANGNRVLIVSLEMTPGDTIRKMAQMAIGRMPEAKEQSDEAVRFIGSNTWIYDAIGSRKWQEMLPKWEYAVRRYGISRIIVDSMLKCGVREDDNDAQKDFAEALFNFSRSTKAHVFLVAHSRKGPSSDEDKAPGKHDVRGAAAITDQVDNGFSVWRNKAKEKALSMAKINGLCPDAKTVSMPDASIAFWKNRKRGVEPYQPLWLNNSSGQFVDNKEGRAKVYLVSKK